MEVNKHKPKERPKLDSILIELGVSCSEALVEICEKRDSKRRKTNCDVSDGTLLIEQQEGSRAGERAESGEVTWHWSPRVLQTMVRIFSSFYYI